MATTVGRALPSYAGCALQGTHEARRALGEGVLPSPKRSGARAPRPQARKCEEKRRTDHARREQPQRKCPRRMPRVALSFGALDLPQTNDRVGSILHEPIGSYTRYMSRLQRVLSRSPPKDGDPAPPCPTLPLPPAKKKERPACPCPPAGGAGRAKTAGSAGKLDARRPRRASAESSRRSSAPLARGGGFHSGCRLK